MKFFSTQSFKKILLLGALSVVLIGGVSVGEAKAATCAVNFANNIIKDPATIFGFPAGFAHKENVTVSLTDCPSSSFINLSAESQAWVDTSNITVIGDGSSPRPAEIGIGQKDSYGNAWGQLAFCDQIPSTLITGFNIQSLSNPFPSGTVSTNYVLNNHFPCAGNDIFLRTFTLPWGNYGIVTKNDFYGDYKCPPDVNGPVPPVQIHAITTNTYCFNEPRTDLSDPKYFDGNCSPGVVVQPGAITCSGNNVPINFTSTVTPSAVPAIGVDLKVREPIMGVFIDGPLAVASGDTITLQWTVSGNPSSCTGSDDWGPLVNLDPRPGPHTQNIGPLSGKSSFLYTITCAKVGAVPTTVSDSVVVNIPQAPTQLPQPNVVATTDTSCGGKMRLTFTSSAGATSYELNRKPFSTADAGFGVVKNYTTLPATDTDTTFAKNLSFTYQLKAIGGAGTLPNSSDFNAPSATANSSAPCPVNPPTAVTAIAGACVAPNANGTITLSWTAPSSDATHAPAVSYDIYENGVFYRNFTSSPQSLTRQGGTNYSYQVIAKSADSSIYDSSNLFGFATSSPISIPICPPTATLTASPTPINPGQSSTLTWSSTNSTSCASPGTTVFTAIPTPPTTGTDTNGTKTVFPTTPTTYGITCTGPGGVASATAAVNVGPGVARVAVATPACDAVGGKINLSFSQNPGGPTISYILFRSPAPPAVALWTTIQTVATLADFVTPDSGLTAGASYLYRLTAHGATDRYSNPVTGVASSPCFDYSLSNSGNIAVTAGQSGSNTITKTLISGTTQSVGLTVSGLPTGASVSSLTNDPSNPTSSSILTIATTVNVVPTTYTITVTGAPLVGKTTTFSLIVSTPPTATISASPSSVPYNTKTNITWSSTNATSCVGVGFATGNAISGTVLGTSNLIAPFTYSVTCTGVTNPPATASVLVNVKPQQADITLTPSASCATTASPSSIIVSFSTFAPNLAISYKLHRSPTGAIGTYNQLPIGNPNNNILIPYSDTNLLAGDYYYQLEAVNAFGSSFSNPVSVTIPTCAVTAPTATISASPSSVPYNTKPTITWSSTNATSCVGVGFATGNAISGTVLGTSNLIAPFTYSVTCTGVTNPPATASVLVNVKPQQADITLTPNASCATVASPATIVTSFTLFPPNLAVSYKLHRSTDGGLTYNQLPFGSPTAVTLPYSDPNLGAGAYFYQLEAVNAFGSSFSNPVSLTIPTCAVSLPTVDLTVTDDATVDRLQGAGGNITNQIYNGSHILRWTSTNASSCTGTGFSTGVASPANNTTGVSVGPLTTASNVYSITCTGVSGTATDSVTVNVKPQQPVISSLTTGATCGGNISLSYTASALATSYTLYRQVDSDTSPYPLLQTSTTIAGLRPTDTGIPGKTYFYQVMASNAFGDSYSVRPKSAVASVACPVAFDYSLSNSGGITVNAGGSGSNAIMATLNAGTSQTLNLTLNVPSLATGATASWTSNQINPALPPGSAVPLSFSTLTTTPVGSYDITVSGFPSDPTPSDNFTTFTLNVVDSLAPTVNISASPNPVDFDGAPFITWHTTNHPVSCTGTNFSTVGKMVESDTAIGLSQEAPVIYRIICSKAGSPDAKDEVTVNVKPQKPGVKVAISPSCASVLSPASVTWSFDVAPPLLATSYKIYRMSNAGIYQQLPIGNPGPVAMPYTDNDGAITGGFYTYKFEAWNAYGPTESDLLVITVPTCNVPNPPIVTCSASPLTVDNSGTQQVTWTAVASLGTPPYTYDWFGDSPLYTYTGQTSNTVRFAYPANSIVGSRSGRVKVTDSSGVSSSVTDCANKVLIQGCDDFSITANPASLKMSFVNISAVSSKSLVSVLGNCSDSITLTVAPLSLRSITQTASAVTGEPNFFTPLTTSKVFPAVLPPIGYNDGNGLDMSVTARKAVAPGRYPVTITGTGTTLEPPLTGAPIHRSVTIDLIVNTVIPTFKEF